MKATPKKLAKLKRGLVETEQYEEPPDWLAPYYDDARTVPAIVRDSSHYCFDYVECIPRYYR